MSISSMSTKSIQTSQAESLSIGGVQVQHIAQRISWLRMALVALNETYKGLLIQFSYKFDLLSQALTFGFLFIGIAFFTGQGTIDPVLLAPAFLGYVVWIYLLIAIGDASFALREEAQVGTLEQMYMSPAPAGVILLGRTLASLVVTTNILLLITLPLLYFFDIQIHWRWAGLPVFLLTWMGIYGFGFMVAAATLLFKQIGALVNLMQNMMLFLNGSFVPVDNFPNWLYVVAHTIPSTQGIIVLRKVLLEEQTLRMIWQDGSLIWLFAHSSVYFIVGWFLFVLSERQAKRRGLLGQY